MFSRRAWHLLALSSVASLGAPRSLWAASSAELFTLARTKNANVVKYAVRLGRDGRLDLGKPVEAYWIMLAEDRRREELTWTERRLAYGFSVSSVTGEGLVLRLTACADRELRVRATSSGYRAELDLAGQRAFLQRIFVRTEPGALIPRVRYVEISGITAGGQRLIERITPG